jgi:hypothetical protein
MYNQSLSAVRIKDFSMRPSSLFETPNRRQKIESSEIIGVSIDERETFSPKILQSNNAQVK